jgi:hypothetical protein
MNKGNYTPIYKARRDEFTTNLDNKSNLQSTNQELPTLPLATVTYSRSANFRIYYTPQHRLSSGRSFVTSEGPRANICSTSSISAPKKC